MTLFGKLFGKRKKEEEGPGAIVDDILSKLLQLSGLELSYDVKTLEDGNIRVDMFGKDEEMLTSKEGQLLDALQLYVRRAVQHQLPESQINVDLDSANFREQANEALIALAEKLKGIALSKGRSVYFRALPPKDRKVIHQYLAEDGRVKSRSVGEGHFKKIKVYPTKDVEDGQEEYDSPDENFGNR